MSYQDQYGNPDSQTDEFGNSVYETDQYGNPVHHAGGTGVYRTTHPSGNTMPLTGSGYDESQQQMHSQTDEFGNLVGQTDRYENPFHHAGGTGAYVTTHPSGTTVPLTGSGYSESQQQMHRQTDEFGNQVRQTDEFGNPVGQTNRYGNPVHHAGGTGVYGTTHPSGTTVPLTGSSYDESQQQMHRQIDEFGNQVRQTDEFGNPVRQTDRYGNPVHHAGGTGAYGTTHHSGTTMPLTGSCYGESQHQKKGMLEKIKEKLHGHH